MSKRAWAAASVVVFALVVRAGLALRATEVDPLAHARDAARTLGNPEASVPVQCYAATAGRSNGCWVCHGVGRVANPKTDLALQTEYGFSDVARVDHWLNAWADHSADVAAQSDADIERWIREDNYTPLRRALSTAPADYQGYRPDLDLARGFDADGFALDGSGWRTLRYHPLPGAFWPTNGGIGEVFIRLPAAFRESSPGVPSLRVAKANFALLEAAMASDPRRVNAEVDRRIEPIDERDLGVDLDEDGALGIATQLQILPTWYLGAARGTPVTRGLYPVGTEFLHPVRYLDPDSPDGAARRLKELRYSYKARWLDVPMLQAVQEEELERKEQGALPRFRGTPFTGFLTEGGWVLQGFIEDASGALRLQTHEEHAACVGCHGGLGVTQDGSFAFVRKVPGLGGWRPQDLHGLSDVPQVGHSQGEVLTWLQRVGAGDELRSNDEMLERFFLSDGGVDDGVVLAQPDLAALLLPSRRRALDLDKAYRALVREQRFELGRDAPLRPPTAVHRTIDGTDTGLAASGRVFADGSLFLDWPRLAPSPEARR